MFRTREDDAPQEVGTGLGLPAAALAHDQIAPSPTKPPLRTAPGWRERLSARLSALDLAPDLGRGIGSLRWLRGVGTFIGLSSAAIAFWPDFGPARFYFHHGPSGNRKPSYRLNYTQEIK